MTTSENQTKPLLFLDLAKAVRETWERSGYLWQDLVDGFGSGDGAGLPSEGMFRELALDVVASCASGQPEPELRRVMSSRLYRKHFDVDAHQDFMGDNDKNTDRAELIGLAVWDYLYTRMEHEYDEDAAQQGKLEFSSR